MARSNLPLARLSADRPVERPEEDLFGYAPFAKQLADSICKLEAPDGLVIAVHGPWGSGKSTLLNFVKWYLEESPKKEQPVLVSFNPWWFSGQENLARAFLGQLRAVLPDRLRRLKALGSMIGEFSDGIAATAEALGYSAVGGVAKAALGRKPKDIPALKKRIADVLKRQKQRILVLVDDIDRLTPEDIRQLFKVIKALADFPNVAYLLAFDRAMAVKALSDDRGTSGQVYLEKIVQVPFELPAIDRTSLRNALFRRLDGLFEGTSSDLFDSTYWGNVYFEGIDPFIQVPRDIERLVNTLAVTYAAVRARLTWWTSWGSRSFASSCLTSTVSLDRIRRISLGTATMWVDGRNSSCGRFMIRGWIRFQRTLGVVLDKCSYGCFRSWVWYGRI